MKELNPKISVIVPVYKAESYLHRCVDSLLAQTFQNFEILLVDDGSPDCSGEICDEYAKKDKRVRVFHKENGGVSSARQCGLDNAKGEYTIHADPDDWVEPTMLEELYKKAKENDADMVICDFYDHENGSFTYIQQKPTSLDCRVVLCELFKQLHGSCCNKLIRKFCYDKMDVNFPLDLSYCEDLYVNVCLLSKGIKVSYLPKAFYHYDHDINPNSLVSRSLGTILVQGKKFSNLLRTKIPYDLYVKIYPYWRYKQATLVLVNGKSDISSFTDEFQDLRPLISKLHISYVRKMILYIAFDISPYISHLLYCVRIWIRNKKIA